MRNRQKGFSLIELLIVVEIILIIASISVPNLLRSKMSANEVSAVASLRTLNEACVTHYASCPGYPSSLSVLGGEGTSASPTSTSAELIDNVLQTGLKTGYPFSFTPGSADSGGYIDTYSITASPIVLGTTGLRYFYTDQTDVIGVRSTTVATSASTPLNQICGRCSTEYGRRNRLRLKATI
jgi:prepilin-type N-terminal cleavage/methylation domain-containing protein